MQSQMFERILQGESCPLSPAQLLEFQGFCSARNFSLEQLVAASVTIFRSSAEQSYQFLCYVDKNEVSKPIYNDYQHQESKITIYNNLTGLVLARAAREPNKEEADRLTGQAKKYLNSSEKVRMTVDKSIILNRAFLHYYAGEINKALNLVTRIYEEIQKTGEGRHLLVTAMLMLAQINFIKKNYHKALDLYKKCLETNKRLPTKARVGMAYSFFYLGKYEMARACFQRIVQLDPTVVEAYIGIAIVFDKEQKHKEYFQFISKAYKIDRKHPLVLLHLAEHYLFRKELHKCEHFCQQGLTALEKMPRFAALEDLCRNDKEEMKSRFNNMLGQVSHIHCNYLEAIKYYTLAVGKGLLHNDIALAQCYINPNNQNYLEAIKLLEECYKNAVEKGNKLFNDSFKLMGYLRSKVPPNGKDQNTYDYYYSEAIRFNRHDFDSKIEFANLLVDTNKTKALKLLEEAEKIQLTLGNEIKPELENNIGVLQLENNEEELAQGRFEKCLAALNRTTTENQDEEVKRLSLILLVSFNYGICREKQNRLFAAREIYRDILKHNKYHLDTALRLASIEHQLGNYSQVVELLEEVDRLCENNRKVLRVEKVISAKAYLLHLIGSSVEAKDCLKLLGKSKDIYSQCLELCINYESIMRKGVEANILKDFLRPNREFCYKFCKEDPHATMAYMLLVIIFLADKKFTKAQGLQFFNSLKQASSEELPTILFNMAFFLMNYDDYSSSILVFNLYKEKVPGDGRIDELLALNYLLDSNLNRAEDYVRRNILKEPCNLKYRFQYSYILEQRAHQYYEKGVFKKSEVEKVLQELKYSMNTHVYFGKVSTSELVRSIECPELKERMKNVYMKVKACGEERKFYIKSYIDSFEKVLKELTDEENRKEAEAMKARAHRINEQRNKELEKLLEDDDESEDEEEKERKERERKKQRALEIVRKRQAEMDVAWNEFKVKDQEIIEEKKSRKRGPRVVAPVGPAKTKEKAKQKKKQKSVSEELEAELSEPEGSLSEEDVSYNESSPNLDSQPKKKQKGEKKKKHKHKRITRKASSEEKEEESVPEVGSEKKEDEDKANKDEEEELMKYML